MNAWAILGVVGGAGAVVFLGYQAMQPTRTVPGARGPLGPPRATTGSTTAGNVAAGQVVVTVGQVASALGGLAGLFKGSSSSGSDAAPTMTFDAMDIEGHTDAVTSSGAVFADSGAY